MSQIQTRYCHTGYIRDVMLMLQGKEVGATPNLLGTHDLKPGCSDIVRQVLWPR